MPRRIQIIKHSLLRGRYLKDLAQALNSFAREEEEAAARAQARAKKYRKFRDDIMDLDRQGYRLTKKR